MGAKWPAFLGVNAWSDNIEGWILSHFTLARCGRTNSCAAYVLAYVLAFTGNPTLSASMSLINSYTGGFRHCSTQKTVCTLPCKEMQVQFQRLAGHGQWSWQQPFGAWGLSCNLEQIRLRKHNTRCRGSEVHQHIQALSRIWTERGKRQFGKHPSHLPACDAESVCTARSQNMSWLALMLQSTKCRDPNIL